MIRKTSVVLAFIGLLAAGSAYAGIKAGTGINGSQHDINSMSAYQKDTFQRSCVFCHTPHNSQSGKAPLWNHVAGAAAPAAYTWQAPANFGIAAVDPLVGPSRLCMTCHDGTTAVDSHGTVGGTVGSTPMTSKNADAIGGGDAKRFISDLSVTHPIGFLYSDAVTKRGANELVADTKGFIAGEASSALLKLDTFETKNRTGLVYTTRTIKDSMYGGFMTCASCHDVHNTNNAVPDATTTVKYNYFLWAKEEGSAICLSCHVK